MALSHAWLNWKHSPKSPKHKKTNVVYGVKCGIQHDCHEAYVGETNRQKTTPLTCRMWLFWTEEWCYERRVKEAIWERIDMSFNMKGAIYFQLSYV